MQKGINEIRKAKSWLLLKLVYVYMKVHCSYSTFMFRNSLIRKFKTNFQPFFVLIPCPVRNFLVWFSPSSIPKEGCGAVTRRCKQASWTYSFWVFLNFLSPDLQSQVVPVCSKKGERPQRTLKGGAGKQVKSLKPEDCPPLDLYEITCCSHDCWMWPDCALLFIPLEKSWVTG